VFAGYWTHLTQAVGVGTFGTVAEVELERLEQFFHERHAPAVVHVTSLQPQVQEQLSAWGYRQAGSTDVLVRESGREFSGCTRIDTAADPELWSRTVSAGFLCREPETDDDLAIGRIVAMVPNARLFLSRGGDGSAAAAGAMLTYGRTALLLADSTVEAHRGCGHHSALIRARMQHAWESGAKLLTATTESGSASQRNYLKHGFAVAYSRITYIREM
jgi:hypothetical protein